MGKTFRAFAADFETTVYDGQTRTDVWAAGICELNTENTRIFNCIHDFWEYTLTFRGNLMLYFHNLKFDGSFLLNFFHEIGYEPAMTHIGPSELDYVYQKPKEMKNKTYTVSISDMGQWYCIRVKAGRRMIEIRDSLKLMPMALDRIGKGFQTKHQKLSIEYEGQRAPGGVITPEEEEYLKNDVLVLKEALEVMFSEGHNKLTIGSCCLDEFKNGYAKKDYEELFPNQYAISFEEGLLSSGTVGDFVHKSYHGGWCFCKNDIKSKLLRNGLTLDVNSLYPSMMHSCSGNRYPVGNPHYFEGEIPEIAKQEYYFVRFKSRFRLKDGKLPTVQIKGSFLYKSTEWLSTSDIYNPKDGKYYPAYEKNGEIIQAIPELTMTGPDFALFLEHYDVTDLTILDGVWYRAEIVLFDSYINKYMEIKKNSKGAKREIAKLFLNNLYGKMAASEESSYQVVFQTEDGLKFWTVKEYDKEPGYIPIGSAVTSYSRCFTIRAAQANYDRFAYSDTDSIHLYDIKAENVKGVTIDSANMCCWKLECEWNVGYFVRQKTYLEVEKEKMAITCAGMPQVCKDQFVEEWKAGQKRIQDFDRGLKIPGKLRPKQIKGGVILEKTYFTMR